MPDYVSLSNVFIDDILLPDGQIFIGVLGGAGVHAMAGARVWSDSLGLIASIGRDFEDDFLTELEQLGLDLTMLFEAQEKTTRAWQIFQPDEERIEIFRDKQSLVHQLTLTEIEISDDYREAKGYHFHFSGTLDEVLKNLQMIRGFKTDIKIVMEPTISEAVWGEAEFRQILPLVDVFSPNTIEGEQITGRSQPRKMIEELIEWGAVRVALRMGEQGSLLFGEENEFTKIPAVKETIVDVTGAGNAYLGGMLVGICEGLSFTESALRGAVSASFAIEQFGVCLFNETMKDARDLRLENARKMLAETSGK